MYIYTHTTLSHSLSVCLCFPHILSLLLIHMYTHKYSFSITLHSLSTSYFAFKVLATILAIFFPDYASRVIFSTYTIFSVFSCFIVALLDDLNETGSWDFTTATILINSIAAGKLVWEDPRLALMIPFQIAFGFCSSFVPYYVFGTIISGSENLGSTYVGLLSAVIVLTGAAIALPSAWAANAIGKVCIYIYICIMLHSSYSTEREKIICIV